MGAEPPSSPFRDIIGIVTFCGGGSPRRRSVGPRLGEPRLRWAPSRRAATTLGPVSESRDYVGPRLGEPRLEGGHDRLAFVISASEEGIPNRRLKNTNQEQTTPDI